MDLRGLVSTARRLGAFDPLRTTALGASAIWWGPSTATAYAAAALRHPRRAAVVDDRGTLSYAALDQRSTRVAGALRHAGVRAGDPVGLRCRNHRGFVEANLALAKLGARVVYLNPTLPAVQLDTVIEREGIRTVVSDVDLPAMPSDTSVQVVPVDHPSDPDWSFPTLERGRWSLPPRTFGGDDPVVLTSGTTGAPKGTNRRPDAGAAVGAFGVLEKIPYERGQVMVLPAPLFHAWGLSQLLVAATMADTVVLRPTFEPGQVLADVEALGADVLIAVPVMLRRLLDAEGAGSSDLGSLRIVASSGSAMPGELAREWMEATGPNLYSLYGSTEAGQVSLATPDQLLADPATAGSVLRGVRVAVLDDEGRPVPHGTVGRLAITSAMHMDGYTDGGSKEMAGDAMFIGDLGRLSATGELTVVGRADDMIVSGGENIFPSVIEAALLDLAEVSDAAVVGVPDERFGQRVRAVVALDGGRPAGKTDREQAVADLTERLRDRLAAHEVPREIVVVDELPRNAAGKVLRRHLVDQDTEPPSNRKRPT